MPLTKQLVEQDQVFLMFGGLGTQAQTSVRDYLNGKKVPQVFVATGATTFSAEFEKYPYTFGWQPVYQGESLIYAQYILQNTPNAKIGVIYQNDDYGQDYLDGLIKGLGSKAEMIVAKESNDVGAPDLNSQILKLKNSGADTFFVFETPSPAIKALVAAFQAGWKPTIYLNSVANPVPYVQAAQKAAGDPAAVDGIVTAAYLKDPADPGQASDAGIQASGAANTDASGMVTSLLPAMAGLSGQSPLGIWKFEILGGPSLMDGATLKFDRVYNVQIGLAYSFSFAPEVI